MNAKHWIKQLTVASVLAACVIGVSRLWAQTEPAPKESAAPAPATAPAIKDDGQIATVNGKPVDVRLFYEVLMEKEGMQIFLNDFLDLDLVQQACVNAGGIPLQGKEFSDLVDAEQKRTVASMGGPGLTDAERLQILAKALQEKGVTGSEFRMGLEKNALLRALSKGKVKDPTAKEIQDEFDAEYGPKAKMMVLTVKPGTEGAAQASAVRDLLNKGVSIRAAAASQGTPLGELTIPMNNTDPEPYSLFKNWAFDHDDPKKAGDLSHTLEYKPKTGPSGYYLVYLEEMIPHANKLLTDPAVKAQVETDVANAKETQWMAGQLNTMRAYASIELHNPILRLQQQYMEEHQKAQRDALEASTKPAVPTTAPAGAPAVPPATAPAMK